MTNSIKLLNGNCLDCLEEMDAESVDLCVTDCPYRIKTGPPNENPNWKNLTGILSRIPSDGFPKGQDRGGKLFEYNDIEFIEWLPPLYRVMKKGTHAYIMINSRNLHSLQSAAFGAGFVFQNLLVWDKGNVTPSQYYMQGTEFILLLSKRPHRPINNRGSSTMISIPNIRNKSHPTEKPMELMRHFICNSSNEGETVLDPFMGVGGAGVASHNENRSFIGIELDIKYYQIALDRIKSPTQRDILSNI